MEQGDYITGITWEAALHTCRSKEGHFPDLASIQTAEENGKKSK